MNQSTKINLIGCDTIVNSPSLSILSLNSAGDSLDSFRIFAMWVNDAAPYIMLCDFVFFLKIQNLIIPGSGS